MTETRVASDILVRIDDRVRLIGALLSLTTHPADIQAIRPHGTHIHARNTRRALADVSGEPAITLTQQMLDNGTSLETLFTLAMHLHPETLDIVRPLPGWVAANWAESLKEFSKKARLNLWFAKERGFWDKALSESESAFAKVAFRPLLSQFFDSIPQKLVFIPNLLYPSERELTIPFENEIICIAPPPLAWGDNPPWPYNDDAMLYYTLRNALGGYGKFLLDRALDAAPDVVAEVTEQTLPVNDQFRKAFPTWRGQFRELFANALTALYLEDYVSEREYRAFVLIEQRMRGMNILPGTVSVMRRYMEERGNKYPSITDWVRVFPKQLRVAKRLVSL